MQEALTKTKFVETVYREYGYENRIIGVVFARYEPLKEIILNNFEYWDTLSTNSFDLFWAGYGKYFYGDAKKTEIIIPHKANLNSVYYSDKALLSFKGEYPNFEQLKKDRVSIIFVGFQNGRLLDEEICVQFPKTINSDIYRELMNDLIKLCAQNKDWHKFKMELKNYLLRDKFADLSLLDASGFVGSLASVISLFMK